MSVDLLNKRHCFNTWSALSGAASDLSRKVGSQAWARGGTVLLVCAKLGTLRCRQMFQYCQCPWA